MILLGDQPIDLVLWLSVALIAFGILYGIMMMVLSRFDPAPSLRAQREQAWRSDKTVIFILPCLNEDRVLGASLDRLVRLDFPRMQILVVDDGSQDRTAEVVSDHHDPRIHLLQRVLPEAQQGKGEALNAALVHVRSGAVATYSDPDDVIVCVVDADGRMETHALDEVVPLFDDPTLGAVQIGVRINNRERNLLARMQDVEFVLYTQVIQRGRRHLGSVGLGGNGQFVRLSALNSLGSKPWSRSLTEDLDLGVRLLLSGWRTEFTSRCSVHQQGLVEVNRWLKQRTRWFQGHLQSWPLVPFVLRDLSGRTRADLAYHLTSPFLLLVVSFLSAAFLLWTGGVVIGLLLGTLSASWWWLSAYLVAFGPALILGLVYRQAERRDADGLPLWRSIVVMHVYVAYAVLWFVAGWRASGRVLTNKNGWTKTDRTVETAAEAADESVVAGQR
ncbi:MAG: glycosyltransferase family 2 protein [Ornithinimicrobium sp.]